MLPVPEMLTSGIGFTVTAMEAVAEHPYILVPVTKYVVPVAGVSVMLEDVEPLLQV